jgi:hypothetical protein
MKTIQLLHVLVLAALLPWPVASGAAPGATSVVESLTFMGQADPTQANFVLSGRLRGMGAEELEPRLIYAVQSQVKLQIEPKAIVQTIDLKAHVFQGKLKEMVLAMRGNGEVAQVVGEFLKDWSVRVTGPGTRLLVIRPQEPPTNAPPLTNFWVVVTTKQTYEKLPLAFAPLSFGPENAALFDGGLEIKPAEGVEVLLTNLTGLSPVRLEPLPLMGPVTNAVPPSVGPDADKTQPLAFRFSGAAYELGLEIREKDPEARKVSWENFKLVGELKEQQASFVLTGEAVVRHPDGGMLLVLSGDAALTSYSTNAELRYEHGGYWLRFRKPGTYPMELKFNAKVTPQEGWNAVNFEAVGSSLRPVTLKGLSADTQFQFPGAAKPDRQGQDFVSFLPSAGRLQMQWKEAKTEEVGRLFYSAQGLVQVAVGPGLLRQVHLIECRVMQGELNQIVFDLTGEGEVTWVRGDDILRWRMESDVDKKRRLVVQLNQGRKDRYQLVVQTQTPLGLFPLQLQPLRLVPAQAIRYGGHLLVINDGAVRLEVTPARGLSQISPELFPLSKELVEFLPAQRSQAFAYRFSGGDYALTVQADHILPELSVSEMLHYHLGESETYIEAEIELEIREAPLREFILRVPKDFTVSPLNVARLAECTPTDDPQPGWSRLKMLFTVPLTNREVLMLRLEKNQKAAVGPWTLPVLQPLNVKSVRGYVGVSAETGFRLTPAKLTNLTEIANAYFPRRIGGLQAAYRLREEAWQAVVTVERLVLSVQCDAIHLFTLHEGVAHASTVINYLISGTPVPMLRIEVPPEYRSVEFAGRDFRSAHRTNNICEVLLGTPAFGTYTLLVTYDRQFTAQSNTVSFVGVRPLDVQNEQGSVFVVSEQQFQVKPVELSPGLLKLDPGEIPPEHRLLFDAPILAAYQYTARPFTLQLSLHSLTLGETVHQVVDRAALYTQVSREGEVMTSARYFLKNQGHSHLHLRVPESARLWEVSVNNQKVLPVADKNDTLIPLPMKTDPTAVLQVDLKVASASLDKERVNCTAPAIGGPVLLTEWNIKPDPKYRLEFESGSMPPSGRLNRSGFAWVWRTLRGLHGDDWQMTLLAGPGLLLIGLLLVRMGTREGVYLGSTSHLLGTILGGLALLAGLGALMMIAVIALQHPVVEQPDLTFVAPIQEANQSLSLQLGNFEIEKLGFPIGAAWPALLGLVLWVYLLAKVEEGAGRRAGWMLGWTFLCWGALRVPNGASAFFGLIFLFALAHLVMPALRAQRHLPRKAKEPVAPTPPAPGPATALILGGLLGVGVLGSALAAPVDDTPKSTVQSVVQQARAADGFVMVKATLKWKTEAGQRIDFLLAPAVLTRMDALPGALRLGETRTNNQPVYRLSAKEAGEYVVQFQYQVSIPKDAAVNGFALPTAFGLVNRLDLEIEKADVDVSSPQAVSVQTTRTKRQDMDVTRAELVLAPVNGAAINWRPRARDTKAEKAVFYGELVHLFVPTAGVVEGVHDIQVRPALGQLAEVSFQVPPGLTITDVQAEFIASWRFDPDARLLRVQFSTPQARPFALRLRSQSATSPLPYQQTNAVIVLRQADGQVGLVGIATGPEVQADVVTEEGLSRIVLEDFPSPIVAESAKQVAGLTLRRAFRYSAATSRVVVAASAVQPEVRVETKETVSLGEDRTLLASELMVHITKAGVFKLSFLLPRDFEVESLSGAALSHWTELKPAAAPAAEGAVPVPPGERLITLHLRGKTEGDQLFNITLTGPGVGNRKQWEAPRLILREAGSRQSGQLAIVPELGTHLHVENQDEAVIQPGVRQKNVLAFRLLNPRWRLLFGLETVEPSIEVALLQDVTVREGQVLVTAQLDYQIENAGVKSFPLRLPARAENVRFEGELISDSLPERGGTNQWTDWEVKLVRRVVGSYPLRLTYQITVTNQPNELRIAGIRAKTANLQRSFLAVRAGGRLQLQFPQVPAALQPFEWQSIPPALRRGRDFAESKDTFKTLDTDFELPISLTRHEVAKVLPARVERVDLTSVVATSGEILTEGRLLLRPGDKRLLGLRLPPPGRFWYAFVNGQSAWPWRETNQMLLLLEKNSDPAKSTTVEFFYTCPMRTRGLLKFSHQLLGPAFDLPLENITWLIYVPEDWKVKDWDSPLQLISESGAVLPAAMNLNSYLQTENARLSQKTKEAETLLQMGNTFLQQGTPQQARRAYQAAWKLSPQDAAFNEDARVQLHNLKMQQALLGLNQRRQAAFEYIEKRDGKTAKSPFTTWTPGQAPDYTQQQVQRILEQNPAEDNAALVRLAERLIRQQESGVGKPESIRAALPTQGRLLTFKGSLQVKEWADLQVKLDVKSVRPNHWWLQLGGLAAVFVGLVVLGAMTRKPGRAQ